MPCSFDGTPFCDLNLYTHTSSISTEWPYRKQNETLLCSIKMQVATLLHVRFRWRTESLNVNDAYYRLDFHRTHGVLSIIVCSISEGLYMSPFLHPESSTLSVSYEIWTKLLWRVLLWLSYVAPCELCDVYLPISFKIRSLAQSHHMFLEDWGKIGW